MDARLTSLIERLHRSEPRKVSVGYMTVELIEPAQLETAQLGYSRSPTGEDLSSYDAGAWQPNWVVIGHEDVCGDPIFVDVAQGNLPVFTAMHGEGTWEPTLLAGSFAGFMAGLRIVSDLSVGRSNPVELEARPLTEAERVDLVEGLRCLGDDAELDFWTNWFEIAG